MIQVLPFFHSYGLMASTVSGLYTGNHTLCIQKFASDTFLNNLRQIQVRKLRLSPTLAQFMLKLDNFYTGTCVDFGSSTNCLPCPSSSSYPQGLWACWVYTIRCGTAGSGLNYKTDGKGWERNFFPEYVWWVPILPKMLIRIDGLD